MTDVERLIDTYPRERPPLAPSINLARYQAAIARYFLDGCHLVAGSA